MINDSGQTRRDMLTKIGKVGGTVALYQAMTALGYAADSRFVFQCGT